MEKTVCPGCGAVSVGKEGLDTEYHASSACRSLFDELSTYTLLLRDEEFIHQTVVDTYAAQHAEGAPKPVRTFFALVGLYLAVDKKFNGKMVQRAHMELAQTTKDWPRFNAPKNTAALNVPAVINTPPGEARNRMILKWADSVWKTWEAEHREIAELTMKYIGI